MRYQSRAAPAPRRAAACGVPLAASARRPGGSPGKRSYSNYNPTDWELNGLLYPPVSPCPVPSTEPRTAPVTMPTGTPTAVPSADLTGPGAPARLPFSRLEDVDLLSATTLLPT